MPAPILETTKSKVIEMWLLGHSRDSIAATNHISTGAVSNIVKEWEDRIGKDVMRGLREVGVLLRKEGLSIAQCAIGFRIMKMFADQGVDGEAAEHFVSNLYKECNRLGFTPGNVATHIYDLVKFSKEENVRLPEIKAYIDNKVVQKEELDDQVKQLINTLATLERKKSELQNSYEIILEQKKKAEYEINSFLNYKQELEKLGISMANDMLKFANTVKSIAEYGYDPQRVLEEFRDTQYHWDKLRALKIAIKEAQENFERLESQNSSILKRIGFHSNKADLYNELDGAGFGITELSELLDMIKNIAASNQVSLPDAVSKFFDDLETQYEPKLGFESTKDKLVEEIKMRDMERKKGLENLKNQFFIGPIVAGLIRLGLNETEITEFGMIFLDTRKSSYSMRGTAIAMLKKLEEMASSRSTTTSDTEIIEDLRSARIMLELD